MHHDFGHPTIPTQAHPAAIVALLTTIAPALQHTAPADDAARLDLLLSGISLPATQIALSPLAKAYENMSARVSL